MNYKYFEFVKIKSVYIITKKIKINIVINNIELTKFQFFFEIYNYKY